MTDKRKSIRKIKRLSVEFLCETQKHKGITSNFSKSGLIITTRKSSKFKPGSPIKMVLELAENRKIALRGEIARIKTTSRFDKGGNMGLGIKLTETHPAYKAFFETLIMGTDKINIAIAEDTIKSTAKCKKDFSCLEYNDHKLCKVLYSLHDNVFFIECLEWKPCAYREKFGSSSYICNCPIRKEIYKKYKI